MTSKITADQIASFQVHHLSHGNLDDTVWPARRDARSNLAERRFVGWGRVGDRARRPTRPGGYGRRGRWTATTIAEVFYEQRGGILRDLSESKDLEIRIPLLLKSLATS